MDVDRADRAGADTAALQRAHRRQLVRRLIRMALQALALVGGVAAVVVLVAGDASWWVRLPAAAMLAVLAGAPLLAHHLWVRANPLAVEAPPEPLWARTDHPPHTPMWRLQRADEGVAHLAATGVLGAADVALLHGRVRALAELADAEERAVALGGHRSPAVRDEVAALHGRVVELLDLAVESRAVGPGDAAVDARLQLAVDALRSREAAVRALEDVEAGTEHDGGGLRRSRAAGDEGSRGPW